MKKFLLIFFIVTAPIFIHLTQAQTQQQYVVLADSSKDNTKMLIGY